MLSVLYSPDFDRHFRGDLLSAVRQSRARNVPVVARLEKIPGYVTAFRAAFPDDATALSYDNLGRAIGAFERNLVTPSRWDKYLAGNRRQVDGRIHAGLEPAARI